MSRPFCWPMTITGLPSKKAMPDNDRGIVGKGAVAVQLEEVREQPLDVVERVRALRVTRELHSFPGRIHGRWRCSRCGVMFHR